jgi:hypothetical protein
MIVNILRVAGVILQKKGRATGLPVESTSAIVPGLHQTRHNIFLPQSLVMDDLCL